MMKRAFDVVVGGGLLLLSLPLLFACALLVRLSSPGPVFFAQWRCGEGEQPFRCLKLRTMVADAERWLERDGELRERHRRNGYKLHHREDPRVTRVGRFLRYTHLDELPQLFNVLKGEMSLVGPRPIEREQYEAWLRQHPEAWRVTLVKPGVFGAWTAKGRGRPGDPERIQLELDYVRRQSLALDLRILLRNVPVLLQGQEEGEDEAVLGR